MLLKCSCYFSSFADIQHVASLVFLCRANYQDICSFFLASSIVKLVIDGWSIGQVIWVVRALCQ